MENGHLKKIQESGSSQEHSAAVVSLGCVKNLVDSETIIPQLIDSGYDMTTDYAQASLLVVNTCGFLESAVEEAIQTILKLAQYKDTGACRHLMVMGCMVQRYGKKLLSLLPEVDLFIGTSHYHEVGRILLARQNGEGRKLWISPPRALITSDTMRLRSSAPHTAYVKIAEGCSNHCTFCIIPKLRGPYRSRTVEDILLEASRLVEEGVKEINLIAQDTTAFGSDHDDRQALSRLLESLNGLEGLKWIRILYAYPERIDEDLLGTMAQTDKVVPYLDIPFQHCVPRILRAMGRTGAIHVERVIDRIRAYIPDIALRTSLMVGFPGETEDDFLQLVRFVEHVGFDHLGVFAFSPERGSRAARLPLQVDPEIREDRRKILLEVQREVSRRRLKRLVAKALPVLVEGYHTETEFLLTGRLATQAPEVDGEVIIASGFAPEGEIVLARITRTHDYDVEAELLTSDETGAKEGETTLLRVRPSKTL